MTPPTVVSTAKPLKIRIKNRHHGSHLTSMRSGDLEVNLINPDIVRTTKELKSKPPITFQFKKGIISSFNSIK
jgi:hypothetical protein